MAELNHWLDQGNGWKGIVKNPGMAICIGDQQSTVLVAIDNCNMHGSANYFCGHSWGNLPTIFIRDCVTRENV